MLIFLAATQILQITYTQQMWPIDTSQAPTSVVSQPPTIYVGYDLVPPMDYTRWTTSVYFDVSSIGPVTVNQADLIFYVSLAQYNEPSYMIFQQPLSAYMVGVNNTASLVGQGGDYSNVNITIEGSVQPTQTNRLTISDPILRLDVTPITTQNPTTTPTPTMNPTTQNPTTQNPTTMIPTTQNPTTMIPTTMIPTTSIQTTRSPTTIIPTTHIPTTTIPTTRIVIASSTIIVYADTTLDTVTVIGNGTIAALNATITIAENSVLDLSDLDQNVFVLSLFEAMSVVGNFTRIIPPRKSDNCTTVTISPVYTATTLQIFVDKNTLQCSLGLIIGVSIGGILLGIALIAVLRGFHMYKRAKFMREAKQQIQDNTLHDMQKQMGK